MEGFMSLFQSLSAWFGRLSRREQRLVAAGAAVTTLALLAVWVVLPFIRDWGDREATIAAKQTQLAQLRSLAEGEATMRQSLAAGRRSRTELLERLLTGATPALAASSLQALLQNYADQSRVALERVDLVAEPGAPSDEGLPAIPVQLSGQGDIHGLSDLLFRLHYGRKLLVIDELRVTGISSDHAPNRLHFSVRLHGAYATE
jgi:type II secretory pathway component PulM